jgi:uncharacterized protein (TIGR00299 family) protein
MSRILYFDCFSGISGDMVLGAFLDAGLPLEDLRRALGSLTVSGFDVSATPVLRAGVSATKFSVHEHAGERPDPAGSHRHAAVGSTDADHSRSHAGAHDHAHGHDHDHPHEHSHAHGEHAHEHPSAPVDHHHPHRSLPEIFRLIDTSALSAAGKDRAKAMFQRLGEAEAAIHQMPVGKVHLHEVGALDSIIDIVGAVYALEWAGVDQVLCSPLNVGGGMVHSAHGLFPVPAPATLKLLGTAPVYSGPVQKELVTPTGALIATTYATAFTGVPAMTIDQVGYGAGDRDNPGTPNVLRILLGRPADQPAGDRVTVIECEIDDMNPQLFGTTMERLYAAGALEVFYVPVQMKKNRPGTLLTAIVPPRLRGTIVDIIFRETTTIGLRHSEVDRECLRREIIDVGTALGPVRFKLAWRDGRIVNATPELEDCAALAAAHGLPVKEVQAIAVQAYGSRPSSQQSVPS